MRFNKNYFKLGIFFFVLLGSAITVFTVWAACTEVCLDFDDDGYGSPASGACPEPGFDCDDSNDLITTGTPEIPLNGNCQGGVDDDCDGYIDCEDSGCFADVACASAPALFCSGGGCNAGDGEDCNNCWSDCFTWGNGVCDEACGECPSGTRENLLECGCGNGTMECGEECDDNNNNNGDGCDALCVLEVAPVCNDGDSDGFDDCAVGDVGDDGNQLDCNDGDFDINPGVAEQCDAVDWNCSGDDVEGLDLELCERACLAANSDYRWSFNGGSLNCCGNDAGGGNPYEVNEFTCDGVSDNDCDGVPDATDSDCTGTCNDTGENDWTNIMTLGDCDQCDYDGDDTGLQSNWAGEWLATYPATPEMADQCDSDCNSGLAATVHIDDYEPLEVSCGDFIDNDCDGNIDTGAGCSNSCELPMTLSCTLFP